MPPIPTSNMPELKKAVAESPVVAIQATPLIHISPSATSGRVKIRLAPTSAAVKVTSKALLTAMLPSNVRELPN